MPEPTHVVLRAKHGFRSEDEEEVGLELTRLLALEHSLADVRRLLAHARRIRTRHEAEVGALSALAADLHHELLRELDCGASPQA